MTTHSKELALDDREFELLVEGARRIDSNYQSAQARFGVLVAGRLGLRAGEIVHMQEDWIDWRNRRICIPSHERCTKGKDGGICGYCEQAARQAVEYNALTTPEARLELLQGDDEVQGFAPDTRRQLIVAHRRHLDGDIDSDSLREQVETILEASQRDEWAIYESLQEEAERRVSERDLTLEEARSRMWRPKTDAASREVPFDWRARVEIAVEQFFEDHDCWPVSRTGLNRRVNRALKNADELTEDSTHCHGLRATAATHLAAAGMPTLSLQSFMGWSQASTARAYVRASPANTQRELKQLQGR
jgi:hypothetical protein